MDLNLMHLARMLRVLALSCAFFGVGWLSAGPADDARNALSTGIDEVAAALSTRTAQDDLVAILDSLAEKHFAFATTTRLAVGREWRDFSPTDQARIIQLFSQLIVRTYSDRIRGEAAPTITYGTATQLNPTRGEVPTTIQTSGATYSVTYRMELDPSSSPARWRVYDVIAEGVSLISNYRSQFAPIVSRGGAAALLRSLETKLAEPAAAKL